MADSLQSVIDKVASWPEAQAWPKEINRYRKNGAFFRNAPVCMGVFITEYQSLMDRVLKTRETFDQAKILSFGGRRRRSSAAAAVATCFLSSIISG
jgi:hypothetical protein